MNKVVPLEGFGGGGSSPLNFKIVAYATEEELVAAQPKENTIGVVTTTPINGWIFNTIEPTNLMEGMVWFTTSTSSTVPFNVLKKNGIQVYPISAKQYIGSEWVDKTAKSYQAGEWVDWLTYLYNRGDQCANITGSWEYKKYHSSASITVGNEYIKCSSSFSSGNYMALGFVRANNPIDLTNYSTVCIVASVTIGGGVQPFIAIRETDSSNAYDGSVVKQNMVSSSGETMYSVDVSALQGLYYVGFGFSHGSSTGTSYVTMYECYVR